jgi:tetratricopeptide (TPR) repeat protein
MRLMTALLRALFVVFALAPAPLLAADYVDRAALDELFAQLRVAQSAGEANDLTQQIWSYWLSPDDPELAAIMLDARSATSIGNLPGALAILNGVVSRYPDYAEGWNQRATLYYLMGNLGASLADIDKVLALEPRHFGALSGRVTIYLKQGKRAEALRDMMTALAIDAYLSQRELFPELAQNVTHV